MSSNNVLKCQLSCLSGYHVFMLYKAMSSRCTSYCACTYIPCTLGFNVVIRCIVMVVVFICFLMLRMLWFHVGFVRMCSGGTVVGRSTQHLRVQGSILAARSFLSHPTTSPTRPVLLPERPASPAGRLTSGDAAAPAGGGVEHRHHTLPACRRTPTPLPYPRLLLSSVPRPFLRVPRLHLPVSGPHLPVSGPGTM